MEPQMYNKQRQNALLTTVLLGIAFIVLGSLLFYSFDDNHQKNIERQVGLTYQKELKLLKSQYEAIKQPYEVAQKTIQEMDTLHTLLLKMDAFIESLVEKKWYEDDEQVDWGNDLELKKIEFNNLENKITLLNVTNSHVQAMKDYALKYYKLRWQKLAPNEALEKVKRDLVFANEELERGKRDLVIANKEISKFKEEIDMLKKATPTSNPAPKKDGKKYRPQQKPIPEKFLKVIY